MSQPPRLTDRHTLLLNRARAVQNPAYFLHDEAAAELQERLVEVNKSFHAPALVGHVSPAMALFPDVEPVLDDPELALERGAHDLVVHSFALHWAEDPVGQLVQSRLALEPDGLFLGVMFGGATLQELRASLAEAETRLYGGLSPRVLPMGDLRDLGGLLQRAGFALPVADSRKLKVRYKSLRQLVGDLRGMGEGNALAQRQKKSLTKGFLQKTEAIYRDNFADGDDYLTATFELVFLTGWAPADSQPQPLKPGSASARLSEALGVPETPLKR